MHPDKLYTILKTISVTEKNNLIEFSEILTHSR